MNKERQKQKRKTALPVNRRQAFFRAFSEDYKTLLLISLFMTLFALPAVGVLFAAYVQLSVLAEEGAAVQALQEVRRAMYLWLIPALCIFSVGASGGFYAMRQLVWNESGPFLHDFGKGIKGNALPFLAVTLLFALYAAGLCFLADFLRLNELFGAFSPIATALQAYFLLSGIALLCFCYCEIVVYRDKLWRILKNAFVLGFLSYPGTALVTVLALAPIAMLLLFADVFWVYLIFVTAMALIGFGYMTLLFTLHCHQVFDRHINAANFPALCRRGLYDPQKEEKLPPLRFPEEK